MWCSEPFIRGHKCVKFQLYKLFVGNLGDSENNVEAEQQILEEDLFEKFGERQFISQYSITGVDSATTMRVLKRLD